MAELNMQNLLAQARAVLAASENTNAVDYFDLVVKAAPDLARAVIVLERAVKLACRMADIDHDEDENICDWCETREDCQGDCTPTKVKYLLKLAARMIEEESND